MKTQIGTHANYDECVKSLLLRGFKYYTGKNNKGHFESLSRYADVIIHADKSASASIGSMY